MYSYEYRLLSGVWGTEGTGQAHLVPFLCCNTMRVPSLIALEQKVEM